MDLIKAFFRPSNTTLNRTDIRVVERRVEASIKDFEKRKADALAVIRRQQADVAWFDTELAALKRQKEALSKV